MMFQIIPLKGTYVGEHQMVFEFRKLCKAV